MKRRFILEPALAKSMLRSLFVLLLAFGGACCLTSCDSGPSRVVLKGATMGTSWSVIYADEHSSQRGDSGSVSPQDLQVLIESELEAINQSLSTYISDSEISIVNDLNTDAQVHVSERFAQVLDAALRVGELTGGAYDITVGPLIELWGFGATLRASSPPEPFEISAAMELVGSHRLSWNAESFSLSRPPGVRIDLSSIAKGYAVDQLTETLAARGITNSLVEIGGELRASGERPEGGPWRLAVESPDPAQTRFIEALSVSNAAVATSGDYRNFFEYEGRRYSHLVDPRTGYPVAHDLVSVTVIDPLCIRADALATALLVLGLEKAKELAEREGLAAHFVARGEEALEVHYTTAFDTYRQGAQVGHTP